jgi:mannobiose 2-epimerase
VDDQRAKSQLTLRLGQVEELINLLEPYLKTKLLPFWLDNAVDEEYGGFLTYFDRDGNRSGKTDKTLIMQLRMIYTLASAHRAGFGEGRCVEAAGQGIDFLLENFWDQKYGGWYWICDRRGGILENSKIMYGQSFGLYALAEAALAFKDLRCHEYAHKTFETIQQNAVDPEDGGYWEMFQRTWAPKPGGVFGGDRKTLDVHMHLMEAFTTLYELTRSHDHRRKVEDVIQILLNKMLDPEYGTGMAQFDGQYNPLPAILFQDVWGSDRPLNEQETRPLENTNYGHNIELAWLLKHALDVMGKNTEPYHSVFKKIVDQAILWGVDREYGGIYVEGPPDGPATQTLKEFWQQAEALVGFLDALLLFEEQKYWDAFENVFDFVWNKMIDNKTGEWFALLERDGTPKWDYLGHEWKISYHTVRAVIQTLQRLDRLKAKLAET